MSTKIGFIGLGIMGAPMAVNLVKAGFEVTGYNRSPAKVEQLVAAGGQGAKDIAGAVADADVSLRLGVGATGLDVENTTVALADGTSIAGTHVVIATGSRARRLAFTAADAILSLRTRDDVTRLNGSLSQLAPASVVAVIGGGFIGAEVATALHARGLAPIVLEASERPLVGVLGSEVSSWLAGLAPEYGVELRNDQRIADVVRSHEGFAVVFDDERRLEALMVVEGSGALPNVEWLSSSGLSVDNGVVVDEHLLATDHVAAIGDVARFLWPSVSGAEWVRIEHWQIAADHAARLARYWMTGDAPVDPLIPYFWSAQYGQKIQMLGHARPSDDVTRVGVVAPDKWVAIYSRDGVVTGVVALNSPRALMLSKVLLQSSTALDDALARAPWAV